MDAIYFLVQQMMFFSIPLIVVALGGLISERSGIINIALEGTMVMGGFTGILFISLFQNILPGQPILIIALIIAAATGVVITLPHAYASINMKANQVISGTAINMFAPACAIFVARILQSGASQINFLNQFRIEKVPFLGDIPVIGRMFFQGTYITTFLGFALIFVMWVLLYKTRFGLRLRSCGEHPQAADSVGINVYKMRYAGCIICGALAGMGGLIYIVPISTSFGGDVAGYGFLALAVLIFGQWKPGKIAAAALFFGFMKTIAAGYSSIPILANSGIPSDIYKMIPYIATLIVLAFTGRNSQAPKAEGIPYDKGQR